MRAGPPMRSSKNSACTLAWLMKFFGVPPPRTTEAVRGPLSRNKANANPVGGHSGVPVGLSDGRIRGVAASPT